jgi:hypothetical protein
MEEYKYNYKGIPSRSMVLDLTPSNAFCASI